MEPGRYICALIALLGLESALEHGGRLRPQGGSKHPERHIVGRVTWSLKALQGLYFIRSVIHFSLGKNERRNDVTGFGLEMVAGPYDFQGADDALSMNSSMHQNVGNLFHASNSK